MNRIIAWGLALVCLAGILTGCSADDEAQPKALSMSLNQQGEYTGFDRLPEGLTMEKAGMDGYVVLHNAKVAAGQEVWDQFAESAASGRNAGIRMAHYYDDEAQSPFYSDLLYQEGQYYLFDNTAETQEPEPFSYLLTLAGKTGIPLRDSGVVVLTNDSTLSFDKITAALLSSSTEVINSVSEYKLVRFIAD